MDARVRAPPLPALGRWSSRFLPAGPWAFLAFEHTRFSALLPVPHAIRWSAFVNGPGGWSRDAGHGSEAVYLGVGWTLTFVSPFVRVATLPCDVLEKCSSPRSLFTREGLHRKPCWPDDKIVSQYSDSSYRSPFRSFPQSLWFWLRWACRCRAWPLLDTTLTRPRLRATARKGASASVVLPPRVICAWALFYLWISHPPSCLAPVRSTRVPSARFLWDLRRLPTVAQWLLGCSALVGSGWQGKARLFSCTRNKRPRVFVSCVALPRPSLSSFLSTYTRS